ncbi:winged helix-turn-helix transcriptional regulator [Halostella pelagica]|uniref:winged helix-turn-helix transcriptional regulator n=1 Tax=Halostella pelagica TaxID=2583824 RepID=UPI0035C1F654
MEVYCMATQVTTTSQAGQITSADLFSLLGKVHTLELLSLLLLEEQESFRFNELQDALGLSPNTLSYRLDEFEVAGLLTRTTYDEFPPRVEYATTERLDTFGPTSDERSEWMEEYGANDLGCPDS